MALTKQRKREIVDQISELFATSKMTVLAAYPGTPVRGMQDLRRQAKDTNTTVKVFKNRLVIKAWADSETFKKLDTRPLRGQLLYAFNADDEAAAAPSLAKFAKQSPTLEFVGAIAADGSFVSREDVQVLANLPSKEQLKAQLAGLLNAPLRGLVGVMSGNVRGLLTALDARAKSLS
jgi:large subunit ribosomal protein L10